MPYSTVSDPAFHTSAMSYAEWKREPTTTQVLFGLQLPYTAPRSWVGKFFWRRRVWVEVTFALSMLEPWEKFLVMVVMYSTFILLFTGVCLYLPQHLAFVSTRTAYYLFGRDVSSPGGAAADFSESFDRLRSVASWGLNTSLTSIQFVGSYGASLAGWGGSSASEL